jgi:DNA-binding Lrp family transcriptional regulator
MSESLVLSILKIESRAGRIEGLFAADPELARMWRAQAALTEACRSVGIEDIHVFEGDVIIRHLENRMVDAEGARGTAAVGELLRVIVSPGDLARDTERVLSRCWRAAVSLEEGVSPDRPDMAERIRRDIDEAPTPYLGALRASITHRMMTESRAPSADRLVFMAAEHTIRGGAASRDLDADHPEALLRRMNAGWIFTPSTALTQGRFRAWSPGSDTGHLDLMNGLSLELDRTLGSVPMLRRWREEARAAAAGKHGKSRLRDLVELAIREPILTSTHVRRMLGVSERASLYLMKEAEEAGVLSLITPRKSYRVWATPQMARGLQMRASRSSSKTLKSSAHQVDVEDLPHTDELREKPVAVQVPDPDWEERSAAVLSELDEAMAKADAVLAKYRKKTNV